MSGEDAIALLRTLPGSRQEAIYRTMEQFGLSEQCLTMPLLRLLVGASSLEDASARRVVEALIEQESMQLAIADRAAPGVTVH